MESDISNTPPPSPPAATSDKPFGKPLMIAGACFILVIAMIVISSFNNSHRYYIKNTFQGMEIWKGDFAPMSKHKLAFLEGVVYPGEKKVCYNAKEVLPVAFFHYINAADDLLNAEGTVDFKRVRAYIDIAAEYATDAKDAETLNEYRTLFFKESLKPELETGHAKEAATHTETAVAHSAVQETPEITPAKETAASSHD